MIDQSVLLYHHSKFINATSTSERDRHYDKIRALLLPALCFASLPHLRKQGREVCLSVAYNALYETLQKWQPERGKGLNSYIVYSVRMKLLAAFSPNNKHAADPHGKNLIESLVIPFEESDEVDEPDFLVDPNSEDGFRNIENTDALRDVLSHILRDAPFPRCGKAGLSERDRAVLLLAIESETTYGRLSCMELAEGLRDQFPGITAKKVDNVSQKIRLYLRDRHDADEVNEMAELLLAK